VAVSPLTAPVYEMTMFAVVSAGFIRYQISAEFPEPPGVTFVYSASTFVRATPLKVIPVILSFPSFAPLASAPTKTRRSLFDPAFTVKAKVRELAPSCCAVVT